MAEEYYEYRVCVYPKGFFDEIEVQERVVEPMYVFTQDYARLEDARKVAKTMSKDHDVRVTKRTVTLEDMDFMEDD